MNLSTKIPFHLKNYLKYSSTLIETGTCHGEGVKKALDAGFNEVKSIELDTDLFNKSFKRFQQDKRVSIFHGESSKILPFIIPHKPCVFFLDAHPAGPGTAGHERLMKEGSGSEFDQDTIIRKELGVILSIGKGHCIIIDDCQGENELTKAYKEMMPGYKFKFFDADGHKDKILVCEP